MGSHRVILTSTYCYNMHMKQTKEINNKISTFLILCLEWNLYMGCRRTIKQMYSNKIMTWIFITIIQHYPESKCLSPISTLYVCVCVRVCVYVCVQSFQSWLTLCDPEDSSPPGSSILGIFQARILEWLACAPPGDLPCPGIKPASPASSTLQADSLPAESSGKP